MHRKCYTKIGPGVCLGLIDLIQSAQKAAMNSVRIQINLVKWFHDWGKVEV